MFREAILASTLSLPWVSGSALALGLGSIHAESALNQPFAADIDLVGANPDELDAVKVVLASEAEFAKRGADRQHYLTKLRFKPQISPRGKPVVRVSSTDPVREPYMDFLVEVVWPKGRLVREFTVLLDPPASARRTTTAVERPVATGRAATGAEGGATAALRHEPTRSAPTPSVAPPTRTTQVSVPAPAGGAFPLRSAPIKPGTGLWRTAANMTPPGATVAQTAMALYRNNQNAFAQGNINRIRQGVVLQIPTSAELFALDAARAESEFRSALAGQRVAAKPLTDITAAAPEDESRLRIASADTLREGGNTGREPGPPGQGVPSSADIEQELLLVRETGESTRQETDELRARVRQLEASLADIRDLLALRNAELGRLRGSSEMATAGSVPAEPDPSLSRAGHPTVNAEGQSVVGGTTEGLAGTAASTESAGTAIEPTTAPLVVDTMPAVTEAQAGGNAGTQSPGEPSATPGVEDVAVTEAHKVAVGLRTGPDAAAERLGDSMMPASPESQTATTALGVGDLPLVGSILAPVPIPILWSGMVAAPVLSLLAWLAVRRRRRLDEGLSDLGLPSLPSVQGEGTSPLPPLPEVKHTHVDRIVERPLLPKSESEVANLPGPDDEADAVAEADIYIAYGRYRDAQGLLRQAIARSPHSADLHYKLAEACCSADDYGALAFLLNDMQAQGMDQVYPDQWRLLVERAANGQRPADPQPVRADLRLGPGAPVAGFGQAAPLLSNDIGQDVWTGGVRRFEDDGIAPEGGMHGSDADLELTMEDLAQPTDGDLAALGVVPSVVGASPRPLPQRAAQPGSGPVLPPSVEPAAELTFKPDYDFALDLDTWPGAESTEISPADDLDLNWAEPVPPPGPLPGLGAETTPLQLGPTEPGTAASNSVPFHWQRDGGLWGEVGTKLDLGRAYVEMNDPDAAQAILAEVIEEGDADQQMDARRLLAQLTGH